MMFEIHIETVDEIINAVSEHFKIPVAVLKNPKNKLARVARARHVGQYLAVMMTFKSKQHIAECFNQRDHGSVIYGCNKVMELLRSDERSKKTVNAVRAMLEKRAK